MILVVGVSSLWGSSVVHKLLKKGYPVRVLVSRRSLQNGSAGQRLVSTIRSLVAAGARPVWGDLHSVASLRSALTDVRTVITTVNATMNWGVDSIETADYRNTVNLIDAAQAAGVRRFLLAAMPGASGNGADRTAPVIAEYEQILKRSGMTYTIVQPTNLMETWIDMMVGIPLMTRQAVMLIGRGDHAHNFISEQDVADYISAMIEHPQAYNRSIVVGGPESCTWTEIVSRVRSRMGAELPIQYAMMGTPITYLPETVNALVSEFERYEYHLDISQTARTFGVRPTTIDEYIDRTFAI